MLKRIACAAGLLSFAVASPAAAISNQEFLGFTPQGQELYFLGVVDTVGLSLQQQKKSTNCLLQVSQDGSLRSESVVAMEQSVQAGRTELAAATIFQAAARLCQGR